MSGKKNVIRFSQRLLPTLVLGLLLLGVLLLGWWLAPTGWFERYPQDLPSISRSGMDTAVERRLDLLLNSLQQQPETARAWGDVAILLDLHQQSGPALECYRKAMELDPTEVRWPYLGGICASLGDSDEAFRLFEVAATMTQHAPLSIRQGQIYLQRGEYDRADQLFRTALSIDDQLIQGHLGLARCALVASDLAAAAAHLDRCEQLQPEAGEVASARAHWWRLKGDAQQAQQQLEAASARAPREPLPDLLRQQAVMEQGVGPKWMRERSRRLLAAGDSQGAIDLWQQSILDDPQDAASRMELGRVAQQLKKPLLALQEYTEAARLDPDLVEAHLALGVLRMRRGDPAGAEKALRQGLVLDSTSHEILTNLGALMMTTGRGVEGVQFLQRACEVAPDDADVRFNLAMAHRALKEWSAVCIELESMMKIDADRPRARFEYGVALAELGRFTEAAAQFSWLTEQQPQRVTGWTNLTRALVRAELHGEAIASLRSAHQKIPGNWRIASELAWFLCTCPDARWRDGIEAKRIAEVLCQQQGPNYPRSLDVWGASFAECGDFESAIDKVNEALQYLGDHPELPQDSQLEIRLAGYRQQQPHRY